jgi:hypothetical protein
MDCHMPRYVGLLDMLLLVLGRAPWRFASSRLGLKRWNDSSDRSLFAECMNVYSVCSRWRANLSIRASRNDHLNL